MSLADDRECEDELDPWDGIDQLERQAERGQFFTHNQVSRLAERINEIEPFLYGLIDALVTGGVVTQQVVLDAVARTRDELVEQEQHIVPDIAIRVDDGATDPVPVDCARRMPVCRAVCCKLSFALTVEEIEAGTVRWDLGQPYVIRHEADGHCTHREPDSGACTIYERRPMVCKRYSCANDPRIWRDFERMELNDEWLATLDNDRPQLIAAMMHPPDSLLRKIKPRSSR